MPWYRVDKETKQWDLITYERVKQAAESYYHDAHMPMEGSFQTPFAYYQYMKEA